MEQKIFSHVRYYDSQIKNIDNWKISDTEKKKVREYLKAYESGKITGRIGTNPEALIERLVDYLKVSLIHLKKDNPDVKDVEAFFDAIIKNKIKSYSKKTQKYNGNPYSLKTKKSIIDALSKYLKWKFPDKPEIIQPLKIKVAVKKDDYEFLTLAEIDRLYKNCKNDEERYFIAVLFSSGARIEEFLNIRYSDITLPKGDDNFVKVRIRGEFSKTQGRTISLYYPQSLYAVKDYIEKRESEGIKPEDPVYTRSYRNLKAWLNNFGRKTLNKRVTCHQFRHSCATWLASRLNRQQMCVFFGWQFSSSMVDKYISRNGVDMKDVDDKVNATEMQALQSRLAKEEFERKKTQEQLDRLTKEIENAPEKILELLMKQIKNKKLLKSKI